MARKKKSKKRISLAKQKKTTSLTNKNNIQQTVIIQRSEAKQPRRRNMNGVKATRTSTQDSRPMPQIIYVPQYDPRGTSAPKITYTLGGIPQPAYERPNLAVAAQIPSAAPPISQPVQPPPSLTNPFNIAEVEAMPSPTPIEVEGKLMYEQSAIRCKSCLQTGHKKGMKVCPNYERDKEAREAEKAEMRSKRKSPAMRADEENDMMA